MTNMHKELSSYFNVNQEAFAGLFRNQMHTWEELGRLQGEFANLWMECLNAQMQRISTSKNLNDIYASEAGLITEYSMKFSDNLRQVFDTLVNAQKDMMACCNVKEGRDETAARPRKTREAEKTGT